MEILRKVSIMLLAIVIFGGPQLNSVDAIKISKDLNLNLSQEIDL